MFYAGLDLGKRQDPTAIAVVERIDRGRAYQSSAFQGLAVRYVERVALGTPYPRVVDRVKELLNVQELRGKCSLVVDATGVGEPVVDLLRTARLGCDICAVTITGGENARATNSSGGWSVPKRDLIAAVQVLLERGELKIAKRMKDAGSLVRELLAMQSVSTRSGRVRMGADGSGQHDDLVMAMALACWRAKRGQNGHRDSQLPGVYW